MLFSEILLLRNFKNCIAYVFRQICTDEAVLFLFNIQKCNCFVCGHFSFYWHTFLFKIFTDMSVDCYKYWWAQSNFVDKLNHHETFPESPSKLPKHCVDFNMLCLKSFDKPWDIFIFLYLHFFVTKLYKMHPFPL